MSDEKRVHDTKYLMDLAKCCEVEAAAATSISVKALLFKKAVSFYHELGYRGDEARCLYGVAEFIDGSERVDCLVSAWGVYMDALAVFKYETSFEWKGETENLDPGYRDTLEKYYSGAVSALDALLKTPDLDKEKLLQRLYAECLSRRNNGGWGEEECFKSLDESFKGKR